MNHSKNAGNTTSQLIVTWGTRLIGIGLVVLGLHVLLPDFAAWGYGVTPLDENGKAYLIAAGARDLSLGLMTLYLLKRHRTALGMYLFCMLIIPVADTIIVLQHGTAIWKILPHAIGVVGIAIIASFAMKEKITNESSLDPTD